MQQALDDANAYVVLVRGGEDPGEWVKTEWKEAARRTAAHPSRKIIPVVIGDGPPPPYLWAWQRIEMGADVEETARRVAAAIEVPGGTETPIDSPVMRPVVENWRRKLEQVEKTVEAMRLEAERVE